MAALARRTTGTMLTVVRANYRKEGKERRRTGVNIRFNRHGLSRVISALTISPLRLFITAAHLHSV